MKWLRLSLTVLVVLALLSVTSLAQRHGICKNCGRWILLSKEGAGLVRDWVGTCGACELRDALNEFAKEGEDPVKTLSRLFFESEVGGIRYVYFEDGTFIDLQHFFAAADWARLRGSGAETQLLGWCYEVGQWVTGSASGHPFGGNEDLLSNELGANFGAYDLVADGDPLGDQIVKYLEEMGHGPITDVSQSKKKKDSPGKNAK